MEMEQEISKIKYICRMKDGKYSEQLLVDGKEYPRTFDAATACAEEFFHAFSPRQLTEEGTTAFGDHFVLVFRTDSSQMEEFHALLQERGTICR